MSRQLHKTKKGRKKCTYLYDGARRGDLDEVGVPGRHVHARVEGENGTRRAGAQLERDRGVELAKDPSDWGGSLGALGALHRSDQREGLAVLHRPRHHRRPAAPPHALRARENETAREGELAVRQDRVGVLARRVVELHNEALPLVGAHRREALRAVVKDVRGSESNCEQDSREM